jgi:hypothetical protein
VRCLGGHRAQLSDGCKAELSKPRDPEADSQPKPREGDGAGRAVNGAAPG